MRTSLLAVLVYLMLPVLSPPAVAQGPGRITGTVTDLGTARPLSEVQITVTGTRLRAVTNDSGRYTVGNVPPGTYTLAAAHIGYRRVVSTSVTVGAGDAQTVDFRLAAVPFTLEAVITTGVVDPTSGTRVPFSVGRVDAQKAPIPATNALETIQGKVAGVTVVPSGQAGSGTNIVLRTPTSINKSNFPLVVVDGVILSTSFSASTADLESMNIESIEVVKGAAAASLYGPRAQSGVIQIRTRRGGDVSDGQTRVTARTEIGQNALGGKIRWAKNHYYMTNAAGDYINSAGVVQTRTTRVADSVHMRFQDNTYKAPIYDQVDLFFNPGRFYKNSVAMSQGTGRTNWFMSYVNSREDGVVLNAGEYLQNDIRLNLDHALRDDFKLSFSGYHSRSDRQELYGDSFFDLINQAPDINLLTPDPDGTPYHYQQDPEGREENPLYVLFTEDEVRRRTRTQGSLEAKYTPFSWLTFDANVSYDRSDRHYNYFLDQGMKSEPFPLGGPGYLTQTVGMTDAINSAASANLIGSWGPLTVRSTLRAVTERERNEVTDAYGEGMAAAGVRSLSNLTSQFTESTLEEIRSNGYFVTLGGDYDGKYILEGLVRRDGSSLFGPEETWNTYHRFSGAYRVGAEDWWPFGTALNEFKLRASQGTAGGRPDFADQFESFAFVAGGGLVKETLGNRFLKPEHATETELGIVAIVRDKYSVQLSYATTKVTDQLIQIPLAGMYGYTFQWQNAGTVEGKTFEATIEAQMLRRGDLNWRMGLVADKSSHEVTEFKRGCFQRNNIQYMCAGEALSAMYGFHFIRATAELPADAQASASQFGVNDEGLVVWVGAGNTFKEGETKKLWGTSATIGANNYGWGMPITLRDASGSAAVVKMGDGNPDFRFGWSNTVTWKNWSLSGLLDVQRGGNIYNQTNQRMYQWARSADVDQAGKAQELKKPIEYYVSLYAANDPTDYFVEDASYVKLRELSLRYRFGRRLLNPMARLGVRQASFSLIGRNLLTFTDYKGYDPDVGNAIIRQDSFDYPRYRTITGSLEITF